MINYIKTSAKTGLNVEIVFDVLARHIMDSTS
jgi:hypothetical protein